MPELIKAVEDLDWTCVAPSFHMRRFSHALSLVCPLPSRPRQFPSSSAEEMS